MPDFQYTTDEQIEMMREELRQAKKKPDKDEGAKTSEYKRAHAKKVIKKTLGLLSFGITVVFLSTVLISVLIAKNRGETPNLLGYQLYVVESGSMSPTLKVGAVIISHISKDNKTLNVNDIVTFKTAGGAVVTHRIIEVLTDKNGKIKYRTKGDNPINSPDVELLVPERVLAKFVAKIPLT
jgi:signal peptidase